MKSKQQALNLSKRNKVIKIIKNRRFDDIYFTATGVIQKVLPVEVIDPKIESITLPSNDKPKTKKIPSEQIIKISQKNCNESLGELTLKHFLKRDLNVVKFARQSALPQKLLKKHKKSMRESSKCSRILYGEIENKITPNFNFNLLKRSHKRTDNFKQESFILINLQTRKYCEILQFANIQLQTILKNGSKELLIKLKEYGRALNNYSTQLKLCLFMCLLISQKNASKFFCWINKPVKIQQKSQVVKYLKQYIEKINKDVSGQFIDKGQLIWILDWFGNSSYFAHGKDGLQNQKIF